MKIKHRLDRFVEFRARELGWFPPSKILKDFREWEHEGAITRSLQGKTTFHITKRTWDEITIRKETDTSHMDKMEAIISSNNPFFKLMKFAKKEDFEKT